VKNRHNLLRTVVSSSVLSVLFTGVAQSAGFSLFGESGGYAVGNYGAGTAAEAVDASIGWYNPAGLFMIRNPEAVVGGIGVFPHIRINGSSTFTTEPLPPYVQEFERLNGSYSAFVPSAHFAVPLGENTTAGLSINAPFGLATDWAPDSPVRYSATFTELLTVTVSPEIGTRLCDYLALGAGLDFQYSRVKFNQMVGVPPLFQVLDENPASVDSFSKNKGASWGLGFHVGIMALFNEDHTRIGINYESKIRHVFYGNSEFNGILANNFDLVGPLPDPGIWRNGNLFSNPIDFPDLVDMAFYQDINDRWAVLGSAVYTGWHVFKSIQLNNVPVPNISQTPPFPITQANIINTVPQNFHDAWRFALGANYHANARWMLRVGGGYDQTPTNNTDRNIRLPDVDRWALAVGAHYQWKPNLGVDVGYTHLFSGSKTSIHSGQQLSPTSSYFVDSDSGNFAADLVGAQVVWIIDKEEPAPMK
jgi:long-chain fatty acid transport protein